MPVQRGVPVQHDQQRRVHYEHIHDYGNPHQVTAAQVGAADAAAVAAVQADIDAHEARADNPHAVTSAQVGAPITHDILTKHNGFPGGTANFLRADGTFAAPGGGGGGGPHNTTHENGGADEISVLGLSGLLADPQTPLSHAHVTADVTGLDAALADRATDAELTTVADALDDHLADTLNPHNVTAAQAGAPSTAVFNDHSARHENGGADVLNVAGLSGLLATAQTPAAHTHDAADINAGTMATARLGSGTPDSTKYLRGDQTWAVPAGGGGAPFMLEAVLAADVSTAANVTPVNVTGLVFTFEANAVYFIELVGMMQSPAATTGYGLQFDTSVAVTSVSMTFFHQLANTGTVTGGSSIADDASVGVSTGVPAANTTVPIFAAGLLRAGANGGTAQLRLRSEVAAISTMKAGTLMRVRKVGA